jgi:glycosyltransferase involved in cell wall biosynthesis
MKKNILITTESLIMGGVETTLISLLDVLKKYEVNIDLYVLEEGVLSEEFKKYVNVKIIPYKVPKNKIINRINKNLLCKSLYKRYKKQNDKHYDVSIAFYGINNYSDMYAAAVNADKKLIWVHNNFYELYQLSKYKPIIKLRNAIINKKFKYFDTIVPVSKSASEGFKKTFKNYENKIKVINNLINIKRIEEGIKDKSDIIDGNPKIITTGRLVKTKRINELLKEFKKVLIQKKEAKLYIIGDGPELNNLKNLAREYKIENNVTFLGNQNNPYKYVYQADIVVSTSASETYSITLLEALILKKYFISTYNAGAKDIYININKNNKNNGILCNIEDIAKNIIYYTDNKTKPNFNFKEVNEEIEKELIILLGIKN